MPIQLALTDGTMLSGTRHPSETWLMVDGPMTVGQRFVVDGIERVVAAVIRIPRSTTGIQFVPDFDRPECRPCAASATPPSASVCLRREGCPLTALPAGSH